jgi:manganese transport protein
MDVAEIQDAHRLLEPILGASIAPIAFAIALIAAGQASTITGTLAGQIVMEGFVNLRMRPIARRMLTRLAAIVPAVFTILFFGESATGELLILSQVVLSLQLSFAVVPLIHLVADRRWMGQYVVKPLWQGLGWLVASVIAALNLKLAGGEIVGWLRNAGSWAWLLWLTVIPLAVALVGLLVLVTVKPWIDRRRGLPTPSSAGVHGTSAMPAVVPPHTPRRIAAAVDFSAADTAVLSHAVSLARGTGRGAEVLLFHVVESGGARLMGGEMRDSEAREDQQRLELYTNELRELGVEATYDLGFGDPADALASLVAEKGPDILVVGSHGHRGVGDFVHGTTVERLRHRVGIPVLVVPATGK